MLIGEITHSYKGYRPSLRDSDTQQITWESYKFYLTKGAALKALKMRISYEASLGKVVKFEPKIRLEKVVTPRTAKDYDNACYRLTPEEYYQRLAQEA